MAAGRDIVYFASVDWSYTWQRPQQLASRLARQGRVLYVDPLGLRTPGPRDWRRLLARLRAAPRAGIAPPPGLELHRPLAYWPIPEAAWACRANAASLRRAIAAWQARHGIATPLFWLGVPSPAAWEAVRDAPRERLVHDCIDDVAQLHAGRPGLAATEKAIATGAGVVFAASASLLERMRGLNPRAMLLPNGADLEHFQPKAGAPPRDIADLPRPLLGYVGEIAPWLDAELVEAVAARHPHASIVLVGPHSDAAVARRLARSPNVHLLGRRPYAELPRYLHAFSVCLLPFRLTPLTDAVNPVKLYEYLASGKPVVTTPLPEVLPHADVVSVAPAPAFPEAVGAALAAGGAGASARIARAAENTWERRIESVRAALSALRA
jgi:glycosyltransferase involved in cell wall biosynthesis